MTDRYYSESTCGCEFTHYSVEGVATNVERTKTCKIHEREIK